MNGCHLWFSAPTCDEITNEKDESRPSHLIHWWCPQQHFIHPHRPPKITNRNVFVGGCDGGCCLLHERVRTLSNQKLIYRTIHGVGDDAVLFLVVCALTRDEVCLAKQAISNWAVSLWQYVYEFIANPNAVYSIVPVCGLGTSSEWPASQSERMQKSHNDHHWGVYLPPPAPSSNVHSFHFHTTFTWDTLRMGLHIQFN